MRRQKLIEFGFYLAILLCTLVIISFLLGLKQLSRQNNSYMRTMVCIASVTPTERTAGYVKKCYDIAEHTNSNHIERYGNGRE